MGPMMVAAGWKLLGQVCFLSAGLICFAMHEKDAGMLLIGMAGGSLVPVAEKRERWPRNQLPVVTPATHGDGTRNEP